MREHRPTPAEAERWRRVAALFDRAAELAPAERAVMLDGECAGDPELRRDIERLLAADAAADDVLAPFAPLHARFDEARTADPLGLAGRSMGRYVIDAWLGSGGMGILYRARDPQLERVVALKLLPQEYGLDPHARQRLLREARAASALDHPNICTVHEIGEAADGRLYIALALYEGETLRHRIAQGALPLPDALDLGAQLARGLGHAHARGVIHRDVKPDNLLVTREGVLKILDFGLARRPESTRTDVAARAGTAHYMSPEQAGGGSVDARSDLWSMGVVLYEMLTGRRPFRGDDPLTVLLAARTVEPPAPSALRADLPPALDSLVRRLLARDADARPADASEVEAELERIRADLAVPSPYAPHGGMPSRRNRVRFGSRGAALGAVAVLVALLGFGLRAAEVLPVRTLQSRGMVGEQERVLIADFGSATGDSILARAVTEAIRVDLERSPAVRVSDRAYVTEVLGRMARDPAVPLRGDVAREVALREGIKAYVEGDVSAAGNGYVLAVRLISPGDGQPLLALRETARSRDDIVPAVDRLSRALRRRIGEPLRSIRASEPLERITTPSLEALLLYARGSHAYHVRGEFTGARDLLLEAIRLDTGFAMAYRKLGVVGFTDAETRVRSLERAYTFRDRLPLPERLTIAGTYHSTLSFNVSEAFRAYRQLLEVDPDNWIGRGNLGILHMQVGELDRAEQMWLDVPDDNALKFVHLHQILLRQGRARDADSVIARGAALFPEHMVVAGYRLIHLIQQGRSAEADSMMPRWEAKVTAPGQRTVLLWGIGFTEALRGRLRRGDRMLADAQPLALRVASEETWALALAARARAAALIGGDTVSALRILDTALAERPLGNLPRFDRPYVQLASAYAIAGRPDTAAALLAAHEREIPPALRGSPEQGIMAAAYIALARDRPREALDNLRRLEQIPLRTCPTCGFAAAGMAWERLGAPDSAIASYAGLADHPQLAFTDESLALPLALQRLAELLEARGDTTRALHYYDRFIHLWADADPGLQPRVEAARRRTEQLRRSPLR